jgi:hypothetical protein
VLAGFAQGAAVALHLALAGAVAASGVLVVAATHRYGEILDALDRDPPDGLVVRMVVGSEERHVDAARHAADRLAELGVDAALEIREGVGHVVPPARHENCPRGSPPSCTQASHGRARSSVERLRARGQSCAAIGWRVGCSARPLRCAP